MFETGIRHLDCEMQVRYGCQDFLPIIGTRTRPQILPKEEGKFSLYRSHVHLSCVEPLTLAYYESFKEFAAQRLRYSQTASTGFSRERNFPAEDGSSALCGNSVLYLVAFIDGSRFAIRRQALKPLPGKSSLPEDIPCLLNCFPVHCGPPLAGRFGHYGRPCT